MSVANRDPIPASRSGVAATGGRFATKGLGLAAQLTTLVLVTQALGAHAFGTYSLLLSVASITAQLVDFGLGRYQFRLAHRGGSVAVLAMRGLGFRLVGVLLLLPPMLVYAYGAALPLAAVGLAFAGNLVFQFLTLNRHLLLLRGQIALAILVETLPAILYCGLLLLWFALARSLSVEAALWLYLLANVAGFAASGAAAGAAAAWRAGMRSLLHRDPLRTLREAWLLARRVSPVGIELFLSVAAFNLPVLLAANLGTGDAVPEVGLYQRVLGLEVAILSVTVASRLKIYYDEGARRRLDVRPALGAAALVFTLNAAGLILLAPLAEVAGLTDITIVALALTLRPWLWLLAGVTALIAAYVHCSIAALGGNWLWERCRSGAAGLATTIAVAALLAAGGVAGLPMVLLASLAGQLTALGLLLAGVTRAGATLRLPVRTLPITEVQ